MFRILFALSVFAIGCSNKAQHRNDEILPGAYQINDYLATIEGKKVGLVVNHTSLLHTTHLVDTLMDLGIDVAKVLTPEHGFKGTISDGVEVAYEDVANPFELVSLYGKNKKPTREQMQGLDIMVFDIQDVGTRFYTYISTMHYVMEACAESDVPLLILDRPNPNGSYVDGPLLDTAFSSFVGMHPIPIVHGMTVGELAQMINGEGWLINGIQCQLTVVPIRKWNHLVTYSLPLNPSPNLPNDLSIALYPSLCLFEGTIMSVGRGTENAFQQIGHPEYPDTAYSFVPKSWEGSIWPPYEEQVCYGISWAGQKPNYHFTLQPLIDAYLKMNRDDFFNNY
ncbi:MAG: DUF1343 domain-containing protein, partial [Bacteroidota bacterium]